MPLFRFDIFDFVSDIDVQVPDQSHSSMPLPEKDDARFLGISWHVAVWEPPNLRVI